MKDLDLFDDERWTTFRRFWRGGWRSTAAWVCVAALGVNGVFLPLSRVFGVQIEAIDWQGMAVFAATIASLAVFRSRDLEHGVTT
ncbi:hypothetical protein [Phenylobacterium sp.]|uniref:hypothetical protein n=1 Tax=Phenylobacterium sp. TaxID=1871053 RepID=UPI0035B028A6